LHLVQEGQDSFQERLAAYVASQQMAVAAIAPCAEVSKDAILFKSCRQGQEFLSIQLLTLNRLVASVVAELDRVDNVHFKPEQLEWKSCSTVADVAMSN